MKKPVQAMVGIKNYFRKYLPLFFEYTTKLGGLLRKRTFLKFTTAHAQPKLMLTSAPVLAFVDLSRTTKLLTHAP